MRAARCLLVAVAACGCAGDRIFACTSNQQCRDGDRQGNCERNGACSFIDESCPTHQRYAAGSDAASAGRCVPSANGCVTDLTAGGGPSLDEGAERAHTCALRRDGSIWCWGDNHFGQLGSSGAGGATPRLVGVNGITFVGVSAGEFHTCGQTDGARVYCWGDNREGELGLGGSAQGPAWSAQPVMAAAPQSMKMEAGGGHTCIIDGARAVWCWGENDDGEVVGGGPASQPTPMKVPGLTAVAAIQPGDLHTCALTGESVWCWGDNSFGQGGVGAGGSAKLMAPALAAGLLSVVRLAIGNEHSCARRDDSTVWCWGNNDSGSVGRDVGATAPAPVQILDGVDAVWASGNGKHTCASRADGSLWCWGSNDAGQLGDGHDGRDEAVVKTPVKALLSSVTLMAMGSHHSCAVTADDSLWCWGSNGSGELGLGSGASIAVPTRVDLPCP